MTQVISGTNVPLILFLWFVASRSHHISSTPRAGDRCPVCGQDTVCATCGTCHYCSDIDLPCASMYRHSVTVHCYTMTQTTPVLPLLASGFSGGGEDSTTAIATSPDGNEPEPAMSHVFPCNSGLTFVAAAMYTMEKDEQEVPAC